MKKRVLSVLLAIVMVVGMFPVTAVATTAEPVKTWNIGAPESGNTATDAVVAKLYTNAADDTKYDLVISGTGEMDSTNGTSMPWKVSGYQEHIVSVTVESGVTNVEQYAFMDCTALTSVTLADTVTEIGGYAFDGCTSLTGVTIPASTTSIASSAFGGCTSLTAYTVESGNTKYSATDGILFSEDGKTLVSYPSNKSGNSYTVSDSVTKISTNAFCYMKNLTELTIPHTTTSIVGTIFYGTEGKITINGHTGSAAEAYTKEDTESTTFVSICSDGADADTLCDVCGYDTAHSHPVCGATCTHDTDATTEGVQASHTAVAWVPINSAAELAVMVNDKNYYLATDITVNSTISISGTVNLCLNGHKVSAEGGYFDVSGTLNLCSCVAGGSIIRTSTTEALISADDGATANLYNVTLDGNKGSQTGNSLIVINKGTVTLGNGAVLTNNKIASTASTSGVGSAVTVTEGTLNINGGKITNNEAYSEGGSTIKTYYGSTVNMTGGEISDNSGAKHGGAIQLYGATKTSSSTEKQTVFNMSGGTITKNSCSGVGGGVAVSRKALFNMTGGSITGNSCGASGKGGGVAFSENASNNIEMKISGDAVISGNKKGSADNNLEIGAANTLTVGIMGNSANVGVTRYGGTGVFSSGGASYAGKFKSDNAAYKVVADGDNLKLVTASTTIYTVTYKTADDSSTLGPVEVAAGEYTLPACTFTPPAGKQFKGWATAANGEVITTATISVSGNTTLYAIWEHVHDYTYTVNTENAAQIIESCTCGHSETATLELDTTVSAVYTGSAIKALKVTYSSGWAGDQNATISYSNNTNAGTASGSVTIGGLTVTKSFTITKKSAEAPATPTAQNSITYGAELSEVGLTAGWTWVDGNTVPTVQNSGYVAYYTPGDTSNYDWTQVEGWNATENRVERTVSVTVNKQKVTMPTENTATFTYTGTAQTYMVTASTLYEISNETQTNAGSYTVTATLQDTANYEWADGTTAVLEYTFKIEQKELGIAWSNTTLTYNGSAQKPTATATGVVNNDEVTLTVSGEQTNVGTHTATVSAISNSNYKLPDAKATSFTISAKSLTNPTLTLNVSNFTYDGGEKKPTVTVMDGSTTLTEDTDYTITWPADCASVGTKTVTVTFKGNYSGNETVEYAIVAADSSCTVPAAVDNLVYTGSAQNLVTAATPTGGTVQYSLSATGTFSDSIPTGTDAGTYNVYYKVIGDANHNDTAVRGPVQVTISKANQAAPVVGNVDETIFNKNDGKITDVTNAMEYRKNGTDTYTDIVGVEIAGLADGTYYVRLKGDSNHNPSSDTEVVIAAGEKVTVTFAVNGGNAIEAIKDLAYGDKVTAPTAPTKENATFAGWFSDIGCTMVWNFDNDTVTGDLTLYAKWSEVTVFQISGTVKQLTGNSNETTAVRGATVKLMLGDKLIATTTTDGNGNYSFAKQEAGHYNVVVTNGAQTVTVLIELTKDTANEVVLPASVTNSIVDHKPAGNGKDSVAAGTLVGGLDKVAATVRGENQSADKVEVKLTVKDTPPVTGTPTAGTEAAKQQAQQKAIQQKAGGKQLVFFDLSLVKTINNDAPVAITDTGDTLLEIRIPFDSGNKWGITIYRYHGDKAEVLAAVREGSTTEGFWVGDDGYIHIYTHKFSTYAVGYTVPSYGYFVPVTPDTVTSADTFDAGIVVYVTMSMLAATGSAVVIGKKRKEEN